VKNELSKGKKYYLFLSIISVFIIFFSIYSAWGLFPLSLHAIEAQNSMVLFYWKPTIYEVIQFIIIAIGAFFRWRVIVFIALFFTGLQALETFQNIIQIPSTFPSAFYFKPELLAILFVMAFITSAIGVYMFFKGKI